MTPTQRDALNRLGSQMLPIQEGLLDLRQIYGREAPLILEIGCGMGHATVAEAAASPGVDVLAIDVHTPGLGNLLAEQDGLGLTNIRAMEADAVDVVEMMLAPKSLRGVRIYFPDPWPKPRHRKRRLVQGEFVSLLVSRLEQGGFVHCATDDESYAEQMLAVLGGEPSLFNPHGGFAPRPKNRPETKFERRARRDGRSVFDVFVTRRLDP